MESFFNFLVIGLTVGSIYALIALGYTMVYGIVKLINFAHGDILMLGAYMGYFVLIQLGVGLWAVLLAFLAAMAGCAIIGVTMEKTCYKPLRNAPRLNALITAIGVSMLIENGSKMLPFIGPNPRQYTSAQRPDACHICDGRQLDQDQDRRQYLGDPAAGPAYIDHHDGPLEFHRQPHPDGQGDARRFL